MKKKVVIVILGAALLAGGAYWLAMRALDRAISKVNWQGLQDFAQASLGAATQAGKADQPAQGSGQGAISYYQQHPDELERDKRCLPTFGAALEIATSARD